MTETYPLLQDILTEGATAASLLPGLKQRVLQTNGQISALERGRCIREQFPDLAVDTLRLADEALAGRLVLPGTGPALHFIGNPPEWTENPVNDNEYTFHLNRMHHWKTMCEAYSLTGDLTWSFLSPSRGPINILLQNLGIDPIFFVAEPRCFRGVLVMSDLWKSIGWGSIVYLAAVTAVDPTLYEAAEMDGAGRIKKIIHVTLPALAPIITVMLIMESGKILNDSFEQVYNFLTPSTYSVGDVISTFVYRMGIQKMQYSFTTAVDLFKNTISFILVILTNYVAGKTNDYALW